jgi:hypothetical protein
MNPNIIKIVVAAALLIIGGALIARQIGSASQTRGNAASQVYFYDLDSGELFAQPAEAMPPVDAPSGANKGVRAFVYTCGSCADDQQIGYIQMLDEKGLAAHKQIAEVEEPGRQRLYALVQQHTFVAPPPAAGAEPRWISQSTPQGRELLEAYQKLCSGKLARLCNP